MMCDLSKAKHWFMAHAEFFHIVGCSTHTEKSSEVKLQLRVKSLEAHSHWMDVNYLT